MLIDTWKCDESATKDIDVVVCSAAVHIAFWKARVEALGVQICVQNCSKTDKGSWDSGVAWTALRLVNLGAAWAVLGHSERRLKGEADEEIAMKIGQAQEAGLKAILCVGESLSEREAGLTLQVLERQITSCVASIQRWDDVVLAYEPVWTLGTGQQLTPQEVEDTCARIRACLRRAVSEEVAERVRIQFASSAHQGDVQGFLSMPNIDGFLVDHKVSFVKTVSCLANGELAAREAVEDGQPRPNPATVEPPPPSTDSVTEYIFMKDLHLHPEFQTFDLELYDDQDGVHAGNLWNYYLLCKEAQRMVVTTSCFSVWSRHKKTNASGKVIPAIPSAKADDSTKAIRVFFFDDNISLLNGGAAEVAGICNLRDVFNGDYVDFSAGKNGFSCDHRFRHTVIHSSMEYRNVLVQVNILDAMVNENYFNDIMEEYSDPSEKLILFMDVNGTVVWDDTVAGKGSGEVLLSTMFRLLEVQPAVGSEIQFSWQSREPVVISKPRALKDIVRDIFGKNEDSYKEFWLMDPCIEFIDQLSKLTQIRWSSTGSALTVESFKESFGKYLEEIRAYGAAEDGSGGSGGSCDDGIPRSWFRFHKTLLERGHVTILNSFGVDTQRVVNRSVPNSSDVLHITVNYSQWGKRDLDAFNGQFKK